MSAPEFAPSYYEASARRPPPATPLQGEASADVCVVGGGLTGLSCALQLAQAGRKVAVLEAAQAGWGASGRSGGQIIAGYSTDEIAAPAKQAGVSEKMLFDFSTQAIDLLRERIAKHNIDCDLQNGHAHAAAKARDYPQLAAHVEKMQREYNHNSVAMHEQTRFRELVASRRYFGGATDSNGGHLHPLKYTLGLRAAALVAGAKLYENTPALAIKQTANGATVQTANGAVQCQQAAVACNAYNRSLLPRQMARVMPVGTYIAATNPLGEGEAAALIANNMAVADTNFVLDYYRCSADTRLLFGGRVSYTTRPPRNLKQAMRARMLRVFPQLHNAQMEFAWGGYVAITINRFPDFGRAGRNVYYAQGFSGHGIALSGFAGKIMADAICGDAEKFDVFERIRHRPFVGGRLLRAPLLVLATTYYRLRDLL